MGRTLAHLRAPGRGVRGGRRDPRLRGVSAGSWGVQRPGTRWSPAYAGIPTAPGSGHPTGDRVADLGGGPGCAGGAGGEVAEDGGIDRPGGVGVTDVVEQEPGGEDRGGGVGDALAG